MTLQFEQSSIEFHSLNMVHDRTPSSSAPQRHLSVSIPRTQDTLASLYKRQFTLNQQLISTRLLLDQQQTENQKAMTLATARDRANGKLERKLDRLCKTTTTTAAAAAATAAAASPPDSTQPLATLIPNSSSTTLKAQQQLQKQRHSLLQEEYRQWQVKVYQHKIELGKAKERTYQAQQQLVCIKRIYQTIHYKNNSNNDQRHNDLEMHHVLLKTLILVRNLYVNWTEDMMIRWYWLLDGNEDTTLTRLDLASPVSIFMDRMCALKKELISHLDQDRVLQLNLGNTLSHLARCQGDHSMMDTLSLDIMN